MLQHPDFHESMYSLGFDDLTATSSASATKSATATKGAMDNGNGVYAPKLSSTSSTVVDGANPLLLPPATISSSSSSLLHQQQRSSILDMPYLDNVDRHDAASSTIMSPERPMKPIVSFTMHDTVNTACGGGAQRKRGAVVDVATKKIRLFEYDGRQGRNFHEFAHLLYEYELFTRDEKEYFSRSLRDAMSNMEERFCCGDVQKRHSRDMFGFFCFGANKNSGRVKIELARKIRNYGIVG